MKKLAIILLVIAPTLAGCPPTDQRPRAPSEIR